MSPAQELLAVAVALYLLECLALIPRRAVVFQSFGRQGCRAGHASRYPGTSTKALTLGMPLPPLGAIYESYFSPVSISPDGLSNRPVQQLDRVPVEELDDAFIPMDDVVQVTTRGSILSVNGSDFAECGSDATADYLRSLIQDVAQAPPDRRGPRIEAAINASLDLKRATRTVQDIREASRDVRFACNGLFIYLFVFCPLIVWFRGLPHTWWILLAALLPLWFVALFDFVRAHRRLFPTRTSDRRRLAMLLGLTPVSMIRACDALTRHALVEYHPLAISGVVCANRTYRALAKRVYADLLHPVHDETTAMGADADSTERWLRDKLRAATELTLRASAVDPADLLIPPVSEDDNCRSFCPRCEMLYELIGGECPHCPGVKLEKLDGHQNASGSSREPRLDADQLCQAVTKEDAAPQ